MAAGQVFRAYRYMEPDMKEVEHIRRQGYTLVDCEEKSYKQEAACPIFDFYGDIMAALTFVSIKDGNTRELVRRICLLRQFAEDRRIQLASGLPHEMCGSLLFIYQEKKYS